MIFDEATIKRYITDTVDLGDGELMACIEYTNADAFLSALEALGYSEEKRFSVGSTDGVFYKNNDDTVYFYKNSGIPFARAVHGAVLPADDSEADEQLYDDTVFYQTYNDPDTAQGMTYLIRMKDGSFIIIDGGFETDALGLIKVMRRIHPLYDPAKPFYVRAWILTHPHRDHVQLFHRVMSEPIIEKKLDIRRVYANFWSDSMLMASDAPSAYEAARARAYFEKLREDGCEVIKLHTGMEYHVGELEMRVFYTASEYAAFHRGDVNDASSVFTLQNESGKRLMMLGDITNGSGKYFLKMYKPDDIKADIVQVAHHALTGPDFRLYEAIGASCYFWTISIRSYKARAHDGLLNRQLRESGAYNIFSCFGEAHVKM